MVESGSAGEFEKGRRGGVPVASGEVQGEDGRVLEWKGGGGGAFGIFLGGWYLLVHWASVVSPRFGWLDMDGIVVLNTATIRSPTWTKLETFPLATHLSYCK